MAPHKIKSELRALTGDEKMSYRYLLVTRRCFCAACVDPIEHIINYNYMI